MPDGATIGRETYGAFAYSAGKSLALGFIVQGTAKPGDAVEIFIPGKSRKATVHSDPPFDPAGRRLRAWIRMGSGCRLDARISPQPKAKDGIAT